MADFNIFSLIHPRKAVVVLTMPAISISPSLFSFFILVVINSQRQQQKRLGQQTTSGSQVGHKNLSIRWMHTVQMLLLHLLLQLQWQHASQSLFVYYLIASPTGV